MNSNDEPVAWSNVYGSSPELALADLEAITVQMGPVRRLVIRHHPDDWELLNQRLREALFLRPQDPAFPTAIPLEASKFMPLGVAGMFEEECRSADAVSFTGQWVLVKVSFLELREGALDEWRQRAGDDPLCGEGAEDGEAGDAAPPA